MSWESAHAEWRAAGNHCGECERIERGVDRALSEGPWRERARHLVDALASANRGHRFQPPVLLGRALDPVGSPELWPPELDSLDGPLSSVTFPTPTPRVFTLAELKRTAESLEVKLEGTLRRGPTLSRPAWEQECARLEEELTSAWTAYADKLHAEDPVQAS